jgi:hypothetical protein
MPAVNPIDLILNNLIYIIIAGVGFFIIYEFFIKSGPGKKLKPLDRSEVERRKFIQRMKMNESMQWKWFFKGSQLLGKIRYLKPTTLEIKGNPSTKNVDILEMVVTPPLFGRFKIASLFAKDICLQIDKNHCELETDNTNEIKINQAVTFDNIFGIFYDRTLETELNEHIKNDAIFRTDLENLASVYYVKAQEQSTFDPDYAHQMAMKEKELDIEMAKKRGKQTSI